MHVPQESPHTPVLTQPGSPLQRLTQNTSTREDCVLSPSFRVPGRNAARSKGMVLARITTDLYIESVPLCLPEKRVAYLPLLAWWYLPPRSQFQGLLFSALLSCTSQEGVQVMVTLWLTLAMPQTPSKIHCLLLGRVFQMQLNFKSGKQISCHQEVGLASLLKALTEPKYCLCQHSSGLSCVLLASQSQGQVPLHLSRSLSPLSGFPREP